MNELVSVCITTFNRDFLIKNAIERVFKQTYQNIEVIVVDDYSNDKTQEVCLELKSKYNFTYLRHQYNKGLSAARNTAIKNSNGKYFTFVDDDDIWNDAFVEEFVRVAQHYDSTWCFCCGVQVSNGKKIIEELPYFDGSLKNYFKLGYTPPVASQFYFTETLLKVGGYNENVKSGVDHDLWLTLSKNNINIKGISKALAHPNNDVTLERMTTNKEKRINRLIDSIEIWKADICNEFGIEFFNAFKSSYIAREKKKLLFTVLVRNGMNDGFTYYVNNKGIIGLKDFVKINIKFILYKLKIDNMKSKKIIKKLSPVLNINY